MRYLCGEITARTGLPKHLLHAWEVRYGWPSPIHQPNGTRTYSDADLRDLERVVAWRRQGWSIGDLIRDGVLVGPPRSRCLGAIDILARMRFDTRELDELRQAIVDRRDSRVEQLRAAIACRLHPRLRPTAWRLVRIAERMRERRGLLAGSERRR